MLKQVLNLLEEKPLEKNFGVQAGILSLGSFKLLDDAFYKTRSLRAEDSIVKGFGPNNAMNDFLRLLANCADSEGLFFVLINTLVAGCQSLLNRHAAGFITMSPSLNQWYAEVKAH